MIYLLKCALGLDGFAAIGAFSYFHPSGLPVRCWLVSDPPTTRSGEMSRTAPTETERAELMFGCVFCGAYEAEWCQRMSAEGRFVYAKDLHQARYDRVQEVVRLSGYGKMLDQQWERVTNLRKALSTWKSNIYGDTTHRYDNTYLTSRIDALLEQS